MLPCKFRVMFFIPNTNIFSQHGFILSGFSFWLSTVTLPLKLRLRPLEICLCQSYKQTSWHNNARKPTISCQKFIFHYIIFQLKSFTSDNVTSSLSDYLSQIKFHSLKNHYSSIFEHEAQIIEHTY